MATLKVTHSVEAGFDHRYRRQWLGPGIQIDCSKNKAVCIRFVRKPDNGGAIEVFVHATTYNPKKPGNVDGFSYSGTTSIRRINGFLKSLREFANKNLEESY